MDEPYHIRSVRSTDVPGTLIDALATILMDSVHSGASVTFLAPLSREKAVAFWTGVLASVAQGERILLIAETLDSRTILGTVQLILATPENQRHRGEIAKMLVAPSARRRGVGTALKQAAEAAARDAGKTLLILDTVTGNDASRLYSRLGWIVCGSIPNYALGPTGEPCSTTIFFRELSPPPSR